MLTELTDPVLRLKLAFANLPINGLFLWEALLSFDTDEYQKVVEDKLNKIIITALQNNHEVNNNIAYYQQVLKDLQKVRKQILKNHPIKNEVIKIRDAIISKQAYETIIGDMCNSVMQEAEIKD